MSEKEENSERKASRIMSEPPNQTLYVNNLNDKINKQDLKTALYTLFSTYGHVISIIALKTPKMRGQAHIVYGDIPTATIAMKTLEGKEFLGKPLHIHYSKSKSNAIAKIDGTFNLPQPPPLNPSTLPLETDSLGRPVQSDGKRSRVQQQESEQDPTYYDSDDNGKDEDDQGHVNKKTKLDEE